MTIDSELEARATRGTPRGPDAVWEAAAAGLEVPYISPESRRRRGGLVIAVAAAIAVVVAITAAWLSGPAPGEVAGHDRDDETVLPAATGDASNDEAVGLALLDESVAATLDEGPSAACRYALTASNCERQLEDAGLPDGPPVFVATSALPPVEGENFETAGGLQITVCGTRTDGTGYVTEVLFSTAGGFVNAVWWSGVGIGSPEELPGGRVGDSTSEGESVTADACG
jgi:hypothetical protein